MEVTLCQRHRETKFTGDSAAGNRTRVFRVAGGNTNHYTTTDMVVGNRQVRSLEDLLHLDSRRFLSWKRLLGRDIGEPTSFGPAAAGTFVT